MRQGQNNSKRSRGRGRKPQGLSSNRAFDSNGPDVKIRGTAAHVCEKYQQLARDAISAGDRVMAENYYQHAEHYYRLLMASQIGAEGQSRPQNNLGYRPQDDDEDYDDDDVQDNGEQPRHPGQPFHQNASHNGGQGNGSHSLQNETDGGDAADDGDMRAAPQSNANHNNPNQGGNQANAEGGLPQRRRQNRRRRQRSDVGGEAAPRHEAGGEEGASAAADSAPVPADSAPVV